MMSSAYKITDDASINEIKEGITTLDEATTFIVELAANFTVALEILSENKIKHRLDDGIVSNGLVTIAGLHDVRSYMVSQLDEVEWRNRQ